MISDGGPGPISLKKAIGWSVAFLLLGIAATACFASLWALVAYGNVAQGLNVLASPGLEQVLIGGTTQLLGFALATWAIGLRRLRLSSSQLRWTGTGPGARGFGLGLGLGAGAAGLALLGAVVLAGSHWVSDAGGPESYVASVAKTFVVLAPAALSEEVMFRGLPLVLMAAAIGRGSALVIVAGLVFALFHGWNPGITPLGLGNIALAGIFLGIAFYVPGGLWTAFGAHLGWNTTLAALDAPVSGLPFDIPLLDYCPGFPAWLSGGRFGPEGGLAGTLALTVVLLVTLRLIRKEPT